MNKLTRFLALSIAAHMAAVLFLFLSLPKFNRDVEIPAVFVELPATNSTSAATTAPARHGGKIGSVLSAGGAKSIPFSALAPAWKPGMAAKAGAVTPSDDSEESWDMQKSGDIIAPKSSGAVVWVYKKTENVLGYPSVFTRNAIKGNVRARISFDAQGNFDLSRLDVISDSPYLRIYVYRLFEKTFFADPIPENLRDWKDKLNILCQIRFSFVETTMSFGLENKIAGNHIYFAKNHLDSRMKAGLGPLSIFFPKAAQYNEEMGHPLGNKPEPPSSLAGRAMLGLDVLGLARKAGSSDEVNTQDELAPYRNDPLFNN